MQGKHQNHCTPLFSSLNFLFGFGFGATPSRVQSYSWVSSKIALGSLRGLYRNRESNPGMSRVSLVQGKCLTAALSLQPPQPNFRFIFSFGIIRLERSKAAKIFTTHRFPKLSPYSAQQSLLVFDPCSCACHHVIVSFLCFKKVKG